MRLTFFAYLSVHMFIFMYPQDKLSNDQKTSCIAKAPSLLEIYAFVYFCGGYFVGPQVSHKFIQILGQSTHSHGKRLYGYNFVLVDTAFSYCGTLIVCYFLQESSKVKERSL